MAVGLALSLDDQALKLDLRPESVQRSRALKKFIYWPRYAAAVLLLAGILFGLAAYREQGVVEQRLQTLQQQKQAYDSLQRSLGKLQQDREAMQQDLHAIASRIFRGRDLLYTVRALKEHAPDELWITDFSTFPHQQGGSSGSSSRERPQGETSEGARGLHRPNGRRPKSRPMLNAVNYILVVLFGPIVSPIILNSTPVSNWAADIYQFAPAERPDPLFLEKDAGGFNIIELDSPKGHR